MSSSQAGGSGSRSNANKLTFRGKLHTKGVTTDALLKRLKSVQSELASLDQENVDTESLNDMCLQLVHPTLTLHKDKSVKASTACCLADMLRLYAPNAPFTADELKDIFQFFIVQLTSTATLTKPGSPNYSDLFYLLESLSNVKSVVLICDLSNADEMMVDFFRGFLDLIRPGMTKNVEICMADILVQLIDESVTLPSDVLEILLANFTSKASRNNPAAHALTIQVCDATKDRLQKSISQYFGEVISNASREEDQEERTSALSSAHSLILSISRSVPSLLLNVVPQIEEELKAEELQIRQIATKTLGLMFGEKIQSKGVSDGELAKRYSATWKAWLGRSNDKSVSIRLIWVECTSGILIHHPEVKEEINKTLSERFLDPDERVRAAISKVIAAINYETALHHVDKSLLKDLALRCKDKKPSVRIESQNALGRLFDLAYTEIESHDPAATQQFAWIPNEMFGCLYVDDKDVTATFDKYIFPLPSSSDDESAWTHRLLLVMKFLDDTSLKALPKVCNFLVKKPSPFDAYLDSCIAYNGGVIDENEEQIKSRLSLTIKITASQLADPEKAASDLQKFAQANEARIVRLIKACFDPQSDLKTLIKSRADALRRIEASNANLKETMAAFIRLGSYRIVNRSSVPTLLKKLRQDRSELPSSQRSSLSFNNGDESLGGTQKMASVSDYASHQASSERLLLFIIKYRPSILLSHVPELVKVLLEEKSSRLIELCIRGLAALVRIDANLCHSLDKRALDRAARYVKDGTRLQAKYAARLLGIVAAGNGSNSPSAKHSVETLLEHLAKSLPKSSGERLTASLSALGQFFKHLPDSSEDVADSVVKECLSGILLKPSPKDDNGEDWVEEDQMDDNLRAKLLSLDLLTKRSVAFASTDAATETTMPVFRLLWQVLEHGEPRKQGAPAYVRSHLRLKAALCVLKLARQSRYDGMINGGNFPKLAFTTQDECFHVRNLFLHKLMRYLTKKQLHPRYNPIAFLTVFDPEEDNKSMVLSYAQAQYNAMPQAEKLKQFEVPFVRFLHLLAHHPDFTRENARELKAFTQYLDFYLNPILSSKNVSLLYHLCSRLKTVRDAETTGASENLYTLSELAQLVIKKKAGSNSWNIEGHPGGISLPNDIFKPLPSREVQKEIYERQYLPNEVIELVEKEGAPKVAKTRVLKERKAASPRKRKASGTKEKKSKKTKTTAASKKKKKGGDDSSDNDDDDDDDDDDLTSSSDDSDDGNKSDATVTGQKQAKGKKQAEARSARTAKRAKKADDESDSSDDEDQDLDQDAMQVDRDTASKSRPKPKPVARKRKADTDGSDEE